MLAGDDGAGRRALPAGEFLHPVPLAALALLAVNDHALKGSGLLPAWVTGKLSDAMGFVFFPLLSTAVADTAALAVARLGAPVDFSLRRWKLALAIAGTLGLMVAIKLCPAAAAAVAAALGAAGFHAAIVVDPTDLFTAPAAVVAWWVGAAEIRRVPLGRIEVLERAWRRDRTPPAAGLRDVPGGDALARALERYFATGEGAAEVDAELARLRRAPAVATR